MKHTSTEEELFEAAFRLKSHESRMDYLRNACRDDAQVERIVQLLKAGAAEDSFMESGPSTLLGSESSPESARGSIGDFEILSELGRGGMGVVYRARQRSLNREVALKVLSTGLGLTTKAVMRFKREAEAAAKLHHTNIVPIYSTGEEKRIPYYAMELIDGPSLDRVIRDLADDKRKTTAESLVSTNDVISESPVRIDDWVAETLGCQAQTKVGQTDSVSTSSGVSTSMDSNGAYFDKVASAIAGVADALAHAHNHGIIHRDIKPANLLLSPDGTISVNDFGLARMLEQPGMTVTGEFMGTPMYMSPEQIAAGRIALDHRTDIYSLGATLYQLLTLEPPFIAQQRDQVLSQIVHKDPRPLRSINTQIPKDLETICLKAMEKDPDRRYQTADVLADDLRRFVARNAISARRIGTIERCFRWAKKNKAISIMACLTLSVVLSAGSYAYLSGRKQRRDEAVNNALVAALSGKSTEAIIEIQKAGQLGASSSWVNTLLGRVDLFEGRPQQALKKLEQAIRESPDDVMVQATLSECYHTNGRWTEYIDALVRLEEMQPVTPEEHLFKAWTTLYYDPEQAVESISQTIDRRGSLVVARLARAELYTWLAQTRDQPEYVHKALEEIGVVRRDLGENNPFLSQCRFWALNTAHRFARRKEDDKEALRYLDQAEVEAKYMAEFPHYQWGNQNRLTYHAARSDLKAMKQVMKDAAKHGNGGMILDLFAPRFFQHGGTRIQEALELIDSFQDDLSVLFSRAVLLTETPAGREQAETICDTLIQESHSAPFCYDAYLQFLLGRPEQSIRDAAKLRLAEMGDSKYLKSDRLLVEYVAGDIDANELIHRMDWEVYKCEAYALIGLRELAHGNREAAKSNLARSDNTSALEFVGPNWARAFHARLMQDPSWPNWLPKSN